MSIIVYCHQKPLKSLEVAIKVLQPDFDISTFTVCPHPHVMQPHNTLYSIFNKALEGAFDGHISLTHWTISHESAVEEFGKPNLCAAYTSPSRGHVDFWLDETLMHSPFILCLSDEEKQWHGFRTGEEASMGFDLWCMMQLYWSKRADWASDVVDTGDMTLSELMEKISGRK